MCWTSPESKMRPAAGGGCRLVSGLSLREAKGLRNYVRISGFKSKLIAVPQMDHRQLRVAAQLSWRTGGRKRVEHGLQIEGRAADDLQHVGGRGLLLQRFREIARARPDLFEQAHVLDRDDGLIGEGVGRVRSGAQ